MKSSSHDIILGLDIGTTIVKAVLGRDLHDGRIELLASTQMKQAESSMRDGIIVNIPSVITTCERAITDLERISGERIRDVVVSIDAESVKCSTSRVHFTRSHPSTPVSPLEIDAVLDKVQFETGKKAQSILAAELDNPYIEVSPVSSSLTRISIDGTDYDNPIGTKGTDIALEFYTSFAPRQYIAAIEQVCSELELNLLAISVAPFAACRAIIGDASPSDHSSVIVNIGDRCTSIALIDAYGIRGTSTFAMGARTLDADSSVWLDGFTMCLADTFHVDTLPDRITLLGGASGRSDIEETLALSDWYLDFPFQRRPLISIIDLSDLPSIENPTHTAQNPAYTIAIGLIRVGIDSLTSTREKTLLSRIFHH